MIPVDEIHTYCTDLLKGKVMIVSNEDQPISVGHITKFAHVGQMGQVVPVIETEDGREFMTFGIVLPYKKELLAFLRMIPYKERFDMLRDVFLLRSELYRVERGQA